MKAILLTVLILLEISMSFGQTSLLWSRDKEANMPNYHSNEVSMYTSSNLITVHGILNLSGSDEQKLQIVSYNLNGDITSTLILGNDLLLDNTIEDYDFDANGNVYIVHKEKLEFYKSKVVLQKYSPNGSLLWSKFIESPGEISYRPVHIKSVSNSRIHLAYYKEENYPTYPTDVYETVRTAGLITYDTNGLLLWNKFFNSLTEIGYFGVDLLTNSQYVYVFNLNGRMLQLNQTGNVILNTEIPLTHSVREVQFTADNSLIISGRLGDYQVSKVTLTGSVLWNYDYGTNLPSNVNGDEIEGMRQDMQGNIYITGRHPGEGYGTPEFTNADVATLKLNSLGNLLWENRYVYGGNNFDGGNCMDLKNGSVYVGGKSQQNGIGEPYDYLVVRIDQNSGELQGDYRYNGSLNDHDAVTAISVFDDGKVALTGLSGVDGNMDWTTQLLGDVVLSIDESIRIEEANIYPNPIHSSGSLTIVGNSYDQCTIISIDGRILSTHKLQHRHTQKIYLDAARTGMYLVILEGKGKLSTARLVIE